MDGITRDMTEIDLPPDDGSVERALEDLDAKIASWTTMMREAEARLKETTDSTVRQAPAADQPSAAPENAQTRAPGSVQTAPKLEPALREPDTPLGSKAPASPTPEPAPPTSEPAPPAPEPEQPVVDHGEDEALLASLDEETAKAIRMMQRLSPEKKSVRELLEKHKASQRVPEAAQPQKTSWLGWRK